MIDLNPHHLGTVRRILAAHVPACEVRAFGSRATWTAKDYSDLDLAIVGAETLDWGALGRLKEAFEESDLPMRVDVHDWHTISTRFRGVIERDYVVLQRGADGQSAAASEWRETVYGPVSSDFTESRLAALCEPLVGIQTGPFGSQLHKKDYVPVGTPIITVEHLGENRILHEGVPCVSEKDRVRLSKYWLQNDDIVFSRVGSVDRRALVRQAEDGWLFSGRCLRVRPDPDKIHPGYLSYFFGLPSFKEHIRAIAVGATMPSLNTHILSNIVVPYPRDLSEQRAIAHVLGTLDDKIALNRRMNETLEAMARALFQDWFVDFGPTRAKLAGHAPYLPPELWALFPERLVASELGEIPAGWSAARLEDIAESPRRGIIPADVAEETPYIGLEHMPRRSIALSEWGQAGKVTSNKSSFKRGEFLFGKLRPYFHKVGTAPINGICSTDIVVLTPQETQYSNLVLMCISTNEFVSYTDQTSTGTRMPRTSWKTMKQWELCLPQEHVVGGFQNITQPLVDRIIANIHESRTLTGLRDTLLPQLVSGQIRVNDIIGAIGSAN